ncbi:VanZ family protein [Brachybacterium sp. YJGR34]|uniref:VanZ family protein n=1 Tax=Brachybacterium sp. YJGR34 TaxID=2059911 RepID=UPI000E0AB3F5|nr:VanZ family protein [Brachybacterium sp. YJGR34]
MDAAMDFLRRLPDEIREAGGSLPGRLGLVVLALAANLGFYLPSIPDGTPGLGLPGLDKLVHLLVFALTVWAAGRLLAPLRRFPMGWVVIVALAHALFIELFQLVLLPQRGAEGADLVVDAIGIALGVGAWMLERRRSLREDPYPLEDDEMEAEHVPEDAAGPPR